MPRMHVADGKIRSAMKSFLEKMKAMDSDIPEELADDALELAEEVRDALACESEDEEADVLEITKDSDEEIEAKVEDAVARALRKAGLIQDSSSRALDKLEEELKADVDDEDPDDTKVLDADGEEEVTVDPDKMKDSAAEMRRFIREVKPVIASIPSSVTRRKLTDSIVRIARLVGNDSQYAGVLGTAKKAAADAAMKKTMIDSDADFGMDVAHRWNPHYKKEG